MYQAKDVENQRQWRGGGPKIKVVRNVPKHLLVLEVFKSGEMF